MKKILFLYFIISNIQEASSQSWLLPGNSEATSSNFLGTTDAKALIFRTNNVERMRILSWGNVGIGINSPVQKLDVNGNINLRSNFALYAENHRVLRIDSINANTFLGNGTGRANTTGYRNTATGFQALYSMRTGADNAAFGTFALYSAAWPICNSAFGDYALFNDTSGSFNSAVGYVALYNNTKGSFNAAFGYSALYHNKTGNGNIAVGDNTIEWTNASDYNTALGCLAGSSYPNGYNNVFLGANADVNGSGYYNDIAIGQQVICTNVNQARIGNAATVSIGGYANWTNISDARIKKNIKQNVPGLTFINKLKPVTYNLDLDAADKIIQPPPRNDNDGKPIAPLQFEIDSRNAKQQIIYTGFVAQEVEKAAKEIDYDFSGVDAARNDKDLYGLRYAEFVVPLVKAVQELSAQNDELKKQNESFQKQIDELKAMIVSGNRHAGISDELSVISGASLEQIIPNPFTHTTTINYTLPQQYNIAKIVITDKNGRSLKEVSLSAGRQGVSGSGKGRLKIDASMLTSGVYQYSLYVDGRMTGTKQMERLK